MFLPILTVWIVLTLSAGSSSGVKCLVCPPCCLKGSEKANVENFKCFEQRAGKACHKHFFLILTGSGLPQCIKPDSKWLQDKIKNVRIKNS
ncbi:uncharacterized protein LOC107837752 isoform X2 [Poecilia formosa]|uniref:uncharacterized protein LOC107837752 isoform X2 n=1 Tax=Poecilia formosa TaxID=48698 RepID=UPI0007B9E2EE|nr:PREDICTED: uncharacterized protein LOC107837752 isoform X2 [Poecilia formosa]